MIGPRHTRPAFTLVELLLTITLVALILIEAGAVFRSAVDAGRATQMQADVRSQVDAAMALLAGDIDQVACPTDPNRPAVTAVATVDSEATPLLRLRTGSAVVDYFLVPETSAGAVLARRRAPIVTVANSSDSPATVEILARDVAGFTVRYYDGLQWLDEWSAGVPRLIEVTLDLNLDDESTVAFSRCFDPLTAEPFSDAELFSVGATP